MCADCTVGHESGVGRERRSCIGQAGTKRCGLEALYSIARMLHRSQYADKQQRDRTTESLMSKVSIIPAVQL